MVIHFSSVISSIEKRPPSRPKPLFLTPPNGAWASSETVQSLRCTMPDSRLNASSIAFCMSLVITPARRSGKLALVLKRECDARVWRRGELWRLDHRKHVSSDLVIVRSDLIGDVMGWRQNLQAAESGDCEDHDQRTGELPADIQVTCDSDFRLFIAAVELRHDHTHLHSPSFRGASSIKGVRPRAQF